MKLYDTLETQLKKETNYVTDAGELKKWVVINKAQNFDAELIELLLDDAEVKAAFFMEVKGALVFNQPKFLQFLEQKNYLNDSYTKYRNKVGLTVGDKYLGQRNEVALVWPFKDCVLEGGQSREEDKREEIFFNEILAQDEITQLLEPKVLTNAKVYDADGEHEFEGFNRDAVVNKARGLPENTITDNLVFKGNNLLCLASLQRDFSEKVKLIYIDPPYNTGSDGFKYNDNFNHSTWLTFMRNRLSVAKRLLRDDGFIFVQCDDNEQAYLKVLMDEIFPNFLTTICVQMSYVSGEKMAHVDKKPPKIKEFIHVFTNHKNVRVVPQYTETDISTEYNKYIEKHGSKNHEDWEVLPLASVLKKLGIKNEDEKEDFILENSELIFNRVRNKTSVFTATRGNKKISKITTATGLEKWAWNGREVLLLSNKIVKDHEGNDIYQQAVGDIWADIPIVNLYLEGGVNFTKGKKPEHLVRRVLNMVTSENDIVLDFFLGSGTTGAVCHKMNRQYIGIEQMDYGDNDSLVRLQNVIAGEQKGVSQVENWKGGGSFTYLELKKFNQTFIDDIENAKDTKTLLNIWEQMKDKSFLDYNIDLKKQDEDIEDFKALTLEDQKEHLVSLLDKNQLYVNVSGLEDSDFSCTDAEKKVTHEFYKLDS